jgi:hypothetical protein
LTTTLGSGSGRAAGQPPQPGEPLGGWPGSWPGSIAIYLVQEALERLEVGIAPHALLGSRLLITGVVVQTAMALVGAVLLTLVCRAPRR